MLHPRGATFRAELVAEHPLPPGRFEAAARLSKALGTADGLPDVLGLAIKVLAEENPWELLLSSSGRGRITRCLPLPSRDWSGARYSSLAPFAVQGRRYWVVATAPDSALGHAAVDRLSRAAPMTFELAVVSSRTDPVTVGRLALLGPAAERYAFRPSLSHPPGWRLVPGWLTGLREAAYRGSQEGSGGV